MRIRITRKPRATYGSGVGSESLLVGRVYNLAPPLASALMLDGYAELYETLTDEEKRERSEQATHEAWTADDSQPRWAIPMKPAPRVPAKRRKAPAKRRKKR
jgi:hypothetical protein